MNTIIEVDNFNSNGSGPTVYDITNKLRIEAFYDNNDGKVKLVLPPSDEDRTIIMINNVHFQTSEKRIFGINFRDFKEDPGINYFIISNKNLFVDESSGKNWIQEYADFRSSSEGGSFNAGIAEVQQLYDQFSFGINRHSLSLRNFAHYIHKNFDMEYYQETAQINYVNHSEKYTRVVEHKYLSGQKAQD